MYLRDSGKSSSITGAIFNYGCFDLSILPSARALDPSRPLILSYESILKFIEAYTPGMSWDGRKHPTISPAYNNLNNLTPALFIVGTEDGMIDDTILMSGKWEIAGNKTVVKFVPGAPHGFITFDGNKVGVTKQGWDLIIDYLLSNM